MPFRTPDCTSKLEVGWPVDLDHRRVEDYLSFDKTQQVGRNSVFFRDSPEHPTVHRIKDGHKVHKADDFELLVAVTNLASAPQVENMIDKAPIRPKVTLSWAGTAITAAWNCRSSTEKKILAVMSKRLILR